MSEENNVNRRKFLTTTFVGGVSLIGGAHTVSGVQDGRRSHAIGSGKAAPPQLLDHSTVSLATSGGITAVALDGAEDFDNNGTTRRSVIKSGIAVGSLLGAEVLGYKIGKNEARKIAPENHKDRADKEPPTARGR